MDLYQEEILEHYKHPLNHGQIDNADRVQAERNASCGDELTFYLNIQDNRIADIKFNGTGCAISQASASMLTEEIKGKALEDIQAMKPDDIVELLGIEIGPTRLKCALLSLQGITRATAPDSQDKPE